MKRFRAITAALAALSSLVGCGLVLGLDPLPLRPTDAGAVEAGPDADCDPTRGCTAACPHDFCDDFDLDGQAPNAKWPGVLGLESPLVRQDATVDLAIGRSPPRSLGSHSASTVSSPSHAFLVRALKGPDGGASLRYQFDVLLETLTLNEPRGPLPEAGAASIAAILSPVNGSPAGAAIVVGPDGIYLASSDNVLASTDAGVQSFFSGSVAPLSGNWVRIELFVGTAEAAVPIGYTTCAGKKGALAAARILALGSNACTQLPGALSDISWTELPVLLAGSYLFGAGRIDVRIDNVTADFVR